jgi:hypothetical protein
MKPCYFTRNISLDILFDKCFIHQGCGWEYLTWFTWRSMSAKRINLQITNNDEQMI